MKISDINKVLKENGYGFVKIQTGDWNSPEKCYTDSNGKRVKGIMGGSVGPLTSTTAYKDKNDDVINKVSNELWIAGMEYDGDMLVSEDGKIKITFDVVDYPHYTAAAGYDEGYRNYYIVPTFH